MPITNEWQTAQRSGASGACAQVRRNGELIEVRNSKRPNEAPTAFTVPEWEALIGSVQDGQYDL
jgi:hypothetical protein